MLERPCCNALCLLPYRTKIRICFQDHPCWSWICNKHEWKGWGSDSPLREKNPPRVLLEETRRKNGGKFSLDLEQRTSRPRPPFQRCVEKCIWNFSLAESFSRVDESKCLTESDWCRAFKTETAELKLYLSFKFQVYNDFTIISQSGVHNTYPYTRAPA